MNQFFADTDVALCVSVVPLCLCGEYSFTLEFTRDTEIHRDTKKNKLRGTTSNTLSIRTHSFAQVSRCFGPVWKLKSES